jgi:multimeric flavodoxin WrbA
LAHPAADKRKRFRHWLTVLRKIVGMGNKSVLIVYYSREGHTAFMASEIAEGIRSAGFEASVKRVEDAGDSSEFLKADAILLGTPTYASNISWPVKRLIDEVLYSIYLRPEIERKVVSGFTSSGTLADGKKCIEAMNWAFRHSKAKIVNGLVLLEGSKSSKQRGSCRRFGKRIAEELSKT